ncbi:hypothetical protein BJF79_05700 [Actinomadura sp. CNU-125]|uniref:peptidoglycan-binding domain-containing protein n=1 Tax=Actinomadura sp. CNU-125 TaxID=1904961 RepID=UPI000964375A|nr:peptidoglycan-binding domain-containing protein [Actinomadura sp. CNU-125]OLT37706.1 hypothetical protein BJF79_05700 [Actinomadura sp. CNU-125]
MVNAVHQYKAHHFLEQTDPITTEMWEEMRRNVGEVGQGNGNVAFVKGIQHTMNVLQHANIDVDGIYGARTEAAVRDFQQRKGIDADGIFGWYTFRAAFAQGAEARSTPGL